MATNGADLVQISSAPTQDYNLLGGTDTLELTATTDFNASTVALTSVEILKADIAGTTFALNQADISTTPGSIVDVGGGGIIAAEDTQLDLTHTTLSGIDNITSFAGGTKFTVDLADIQGRTVGGPGGTDTLIVKGTNFDLTATTISSIDHLQASSNAATTFKLDAGDITALNAVGASITGGSGKDMLVLSGSDNFDITNIALSSIEILKSTLAVTEFELHQSDLAAGGSIIGAGNDTLFTSDNTLDLTSTTLTNVTDIASELFVNFSLTADSLDLANVELDADSIGVSSVTVKGAIVDLSHGTEFEDIGLLKSSNSGPITYKLSNTVFDSNGRQFEIDGNASSTDTIIGLVDGGNHTLDLTTATLSSIEVLKTTDSAGYRFDLQSGALKAVGGSLTSIVGGSGTDSLFVAGSIDLTQTSLSSVEIIIGSGTITLDQLDVPKFGQIEGGGTTALRVESTMVDLSLTSVSGIDKLDGIGNGASETFKLGVNAIITGTIEGSGGADTLIATGSELDLTSTTLNSIDQINTSFAGGTKFIVDLADIDPGTLGGGIHGSKGSDSLILGTAGATEFDLTALTTTTLDSIEKVGVNTGGAADILVNHAQLLSLKGFIGANNGDTLTITDSTDFNLTSATLDGINVLVGTNVGTRGSTFTLDAADLAALGSAGPGGEIDGTAGAMDTVAVKSATIDLSNITLSSIEHVRSTLTTSALTFDVTNFTILHSPTIEFDGNAGKNDTIQLVADVIADFSSATFSSIEILKGDASDNDEMTIRDSFLVANGGSLASIVGGVSTGDALHVTGTSVNFLSTTLTGIEELYAEGTVITLDQADISGSHQSLASIIDDSVATDTVLQVKSATIDLSRTELSGIDVIRATGQAAATPITFKISDTTLGDLPNGPVQFVGGGGTDTIQAVNAFNNDNFVLNLTSADMSSIEVLKTDSSSITEIDIKDTVLAANGGSVNMVVDNSVDTSGGDNLGVLGTSINLTATTLSGIEELIALDSNDSTFTLDQADLFAKSGTKITQELLEIDGNNGNDTLAVKSNTIDLSSVALSSIETIEAATGVSGAVTFIVNAHTLGLELAATIAGNGAASDTVSVVFAPGDTFVDLSSTDFSSIETLKITAPGAGEFGVEINDFDIAGPTNVLANVIGVGLASAKLDVSINDSGDVDLSSTTFSNIHDLVVINGGNDLTIGANTFQGPITVISADSLEGVIVTGATSYDLSQVHFDPSGGEFSGLTMDDLGSSVNVILGQDDLNSLESFTGTAQDDTLTASSVQFDLINSATNLTSIEGLATNNTSGTTFTVSQDHLDEMSTSASGGFGSVTGNSGNDTLVVDGTWINLTSTTLSSIETLRAAESGLAILIDNVNNLASLKVIDGDGGTNTGSFTSLTLLNDSSFDLSHTSLSGIAVLAGDSNGSGVTFTLDQADIFTTTKAGIIQQLTEIDGDGDTTVTDTILAHGTVLDLHGVTLSGIEDISADHSSGVKYTLDGNASGIDLDLMTGTGKNTVTLNAGYDGVIDNTDESHVLATTLTIDNFTHGLDTIDLSHVVTNGTATFDSTAGAQGIADTVAAGAGNDLHDILNALQNTYDGSTNSQVLKFEYNGDTYIMVDNATTGSGFDTTHDSVVKLSGTGLGVAASDLVVH